MKHIEQLSLEYWYDVVKSSVANNRSTINGPSGNGHGDNDSYRLRSSKKFMSDLKRATSDSVHAEFVVFCVALSVLLHKYNLTPPLVAIPNGEGKKDNESTNFLFLLFGANDKHTFREVVERVKTQLQSGIKHKRYDYDEFLKVVDSNDIFHPEDFYKVGIADNRFLDSENAPNQKFGLLFHIEEESDNYRITVSFDPNTYTRRFIAQLVNHYVRTLYSILRFPDQSIGNFNMLTGAQKKLLVGKFNNTTRPFNNNTTIQGLFQNQVAKTPDSIALVYKDTLLTYNDLNERSNQLANYLRNHCAVIKGDVVGVMTDRSPWMIISLMGIMKAGAAYVPIDPETPDKRCTFLFKDTGLKVLIFNKKKQSLSKEIVEISFEGDWSEISSYPVANLQSTSGPSDLAYVMYTSGSTGQPKGAMLEHRAVINRIEWMWKHYKFSKEDVILQKTPFVFDVSVWELFMTLCYGAKLVLCDKDIIYNPSKMVTYINSFKITTIHFVPGVLNSFLETINEEHLQVPKSIRQVISSGEALLPEIVKKYYKVFKAPLYNLYGPTEAAVDVTSYKSNPKDLNVPIGKPISNIQLYVLDNNMKLVPLGAVGELHIAGEGLARGYLNKGELTREKFVDNPFGKGKLYKTGDFARWLSNGNVEYIGRIDRQVKIRGYRIELEEIENSLMGYPEMRAVVVLDKEEGIGEKYLVVYYQRKQGVSPEDIREYLGERLPEYMVPAFYIKVDSFPLTSNGKIDRKSLAGFKDKGTVKSRYSPPVSKTQRVLCEIWEKELKLDRIGINDDYFALGGDSLKAIRLVAAINNRLKANLEVGDIFKCLTVEGLGECIGEKEGVDNDIDTALERGLVKIDEFKRLIEDEDTSGVLLPSGYEDIYPFTHVEKGMIYASLLRNNEPVYYDQFIFETEINDVDAFKKAFDQLVQRHSILRTRYYLNRFSRPTKVVERAIQLPLAITDLRHLDKEGQRTEVAKYLAEDTALRLSFDGDILWRMRAFRLTPNDFHLVWSFHHAVLDGWSVAVFRTELSQILANDLGKSTLPKLRHDYKDYCAIKLDNLVSDEILGFWRETLLDYTRNKLPFNYTGKRKKDILGVKTVQTIIEKNVLRGLQAVSQEHSVSFKAVCLAANVHLLGLLCFEKDIVAGVVTHDRPPIADGDKIMGCFLNAIPIRVNVEKSKTYLELVHEVNDYLVRTKYNEIHLTDITRSIGEKVSDRNPIFDCLFNFVDFHILEDFLDNSVVPKDDGNSYTLDIQGFEMTDTLFDMEVVKTLDEFYVHIKYHPAYFEDVNMTYALELYVRILSLFSKDINGSLSTSNLFTVKEYNEVVYGFNTTKYPYSRQKTLHALFEDQVIKTPDNIALRLGDKVCTYSELNKRANQLANHLILAGAESGDSIGLLADRSFEMIVAMYGILKAGAAYVPIDPDYPVDRQHYIIKNSGVSVVVTDNIYEIEKDLDRERTFVRIVQESLMGNSDQNPEITKSTDDLAYIIYTSGSTGNPKGVMIAHHAAVNLIEWVNGTFDVNERDRLLFVTSICFDLSVYDIFGMLASGGSIVIARQHELKDVSKLIDLMDGQMVTFWNSVPSTMNYLVNELQQITDFTNKSLRLVFMSGDWIPVSLPDKIKKYFRKANVISLGGATEGTVWSNYYPIDRTNPDLTSVPYGKPINNNFFYILDEHKNPVLRGTAGELYIGGVGVALGYMNSPEKTEQAFLNNPFDTQMGGRLYRTGDLGSMLPDGNMEFLGRIDNQVKIRGYRVEPGEIESHLLKFPGITDTTVAVFKDEQNNNYLCAYIVKQQAFKVDELKEFLGKSLPIYMIPTYFERISKIPVTSNGKIDRKALLPPKRKKKIDAAASSYSELENKLRNIFSELLGIATIGFNDDIFESGANSLTVGSLLNGIRRELGASLSPRDIFSHPTAVTLSKKIGKSKTHIHAAIPRTKEQPDYDLSTSQRMMLGAVKMDKTQNSYNISAAYTLKGTLRAKELEKAFETLIERHEILRTVFLLKSDIPKQQVLSASHINFKFQNTDLRNVRKQKQLVRDLLLKEAHRSFDLEKGPLIRVKLLHIAENEYIISITLHHLISDGWSIRIMLKEIVALYNAYLKGQDSHLRQPPIQYRDYSAWEQQQVQDESFAEHGRYWFERFKGELPYTELPTDRKRPVIKSFKGNKVKFLMDKNNINGLRSLSKRHGASLFNTLVALIKGVLYRYTEQEDMIIGTSIAGRGHSDLENSLGLYANTLALRTKVQPNQGFAFLLEMVKETTREALDHQVYPFDMLIEKLRLRRDTGRLPLFGVMTVLNNMEIGMDRIKDGMAGLEIEEHEHENRTSQYDLLFDFILIGDGLLVKLEYNTDIYERATIERMQLHFRSLVNEVLTDEYKALNKLNILIPGERQELLKLCSAEIDYPHTKTIIELFEEQVVKYHALPAIIFKDHTLTYRELNEKSNRIAHCLRQNYSIGPDDLIGLILDRSENYISILLGVLKSGAGYLPISPTYPVERIKLMLSDAKVKLLITGSESKSDVQPIGCEMLILEDIVDQLLQYPDNNPEPINTVHDVACVVYTSGTTGRPKGIVVEHKSAVRLVKNTNYMKIKTGDRLLQTVSLSFDPAIFEIWGTLLNGGELHMLPSQDLLNNTKLKDKLLNDRIDIILFTTAWCHQLIDIDTDLFGKLKYLFVGGEVMSSSHMQKLTKAYPSLTITNVYGPSENTVFSTYYCLPKTLSPVIPIGKPIANSTVYIMDKLMQLVPIGVSGEIVVGGDGLARGYLNDPQLTNEKFVTSEFGRLYRTGDRGRWLASGTIEYQGRQDNQVKIRGFRIELDEIKNILLKNPAIINAVVIMRETGGEKTILAYVVLRERVSKDGIREFTAKYLPDYMVPNTIMEIRAIPLNENGKADISALPSDTEQPLTPGNNVPININEARILKIWLRIFGNKNIGVTDDFFALGGHSLRAILMLSYISKEFEVAIELDDIFMNPTIKGLAKIIDNAEKKAYKEIKCITEQNLYDVSHAQKRVWLSSQVPEESVTFNIVNAYKVKGALNLPVFKRAFEEMIKRHESLRTTFVYVDGEPKQKLHSFDRYFSEIDYVNNTSGNPKDIVKKINERGCQVFNLEKGPLVKLVIIELSESEFIFSLMIHHIVADLWSLEIFINEITALYNAFCKDKKCFLPPLSVQYKDYSFWQNQQLSNLEAEKHKNYWLSKLGGDLPRLKLTLDRPRPKIKSYRGDIFQFLIGRDCSSALRKISGENHTSLFVVLLSAVNILLFKNTGQKDIVVGMPSIGRRQKELENQIGFYSNLIALRTIFNPDDSFTALLHEVRDQVLTAQKHDIYPFDRVVEDLKLKKEENRSFLFDLMVLMQDEIVKPKSGSMTFSNLIFEPLELGNLTSKFDLTFNFRDNADHGTISGAIIYNPDLFFKTTIKGFADDFKALLQIIKDLPVLSLREIRQNLATPSIQKDLHKDIMGEITTEY